jgi:hypothetical protein
MKRIAALAFLPVLAGCPTMSMTPEQLKASAGMATCGTATTMYGKTSIITAAADDIRKGASAENITEIICGDASMKIGSKVGAPVPPGATTTTTTVVKPAP